MIRIPFHSALAAIVALTATTLAQAPLTPEAAPGLKQIAIEFRIGTWNLEFLGADGNYRNNLPLRTEADLQAIGRKIVELGVCVLAVQEINDEATLRKVAAAAAPSWELVLGTSGGWDDGKTAQRIGFLYDRAAVDLLFAEELLALPREQEGLPIFHRVPVTAGFRHRKSGCDFRLVTVHLKAGQKAEDAQKRRLEATLLSGWLETLHKDPAEDQDIVLLGDFNSSYGTEPEQLFERGGAMAYVEPKTPMPTIMHFADPIDQVVVTAACRELQRDSFAVDGDFDGMSKEAWRQTYSDHFPVVVKLRGQGDDDAAATFRREAPEHVLPVGKRPPGAPVTGPIVRRGTWPPRVGTKIILIATSGQQWNGDLVQELPAPNDQNGWIVLRTASGETVGVPMDKVLQLTLAR
jgi:endonuclease/exonuclease/phosphatase family metal-dependent hydrolase